MTIIYIKENMKHTSSINSNTYSTATQPMELSCSVEVEMLGKRKCYFQYFTFFHPKLNPHDFFFK